MAAKESCTIGSTIVISGNVSGDQDLVVEGRIEGRVGLSSRLTVEEAGAIEAEVNVQDLDVKGSIKGDVVAAKTAVLFPSARVIGNIRAAKIVVEEGAMVQGMIEMDVDLPPEVSAKPAR